jgi:hypothetical protein
MTAGETGGETEKRTAALKTQTPVPACPSTTAAAVAVAVAAFFFLWPGPSSALCPNCIGQRSALTPTLELVGLFLLVPFAVAAVILLLIRRAVRGTGPRVRLRRREH